MSMKSSVAGLRTLYQVRRFWPSNKAALTVGSSWPCSGSSVFSTTLTAKSSSQSFRSSEHSSISRDSTAQFHRDQSFLYGETTSTYAFAAYC